MLIVQQPPTQQQHGTGSFNRTPAMADTGSDDDDNGKGRNKSRRELPAGAVATLKAWLLSPEHFTHPYPTPQDQVMLMQKTGIDKKQLKNWFTNARRRIWKPMLKKQLEHGKLAPNGPGGPVVVPGALPGIMPGVSAGMDAQQLQYQQLPQASAQEGQQQMHDQYGNSMYAPRAPPQPAQYYDSNAATPAPMPMTNSIGSLGALVRTGSGTQMSKTDSHAVLMELFARDQDLVRQATESAGLKRPQDNAQPAQSFSDGPSQSQQMPSQYPINSAKQRLMSVPTLTSWPHFSSVSSLNNLGTMPGVKSITSLSGADLAKQGAVNSLGNLAQVKSVESMGKNDSYAFLEVFFGDRSSGNLNQMGKDNQRGLKRDREDDGDVGLSLDEDAPTPKSNRLSSDGQQQSNDMDNMTYESDSPGTLKQAFDAAVAARGLMAVSRSSEKLTDLALPAKIRRTLSQEFMRKEQEQQQQQQEHKYSQYQYSASPAPATKEAQPTPQPSSLQYPGQHPGQQQNETEHKSFSSESGDPGKSVEVPSATKCAICNETNVDTQLRPCGHMFHERCLKPSLQTPVGAPKCPIDHTPMQSALLAVPTDENIHPTHKATPHVPPELRF